MPDQLPWYQRMTGSLSRSKSDLHAETLRTRSRDMGVQTIRECRPGEPTTVMGVLHSVTLRPREGVPAVEAELYDGTGKILLVWLGRRQIRGIDPGRGIVVSGRLTCNTERPTIFNPKYELRPGGTI
jgi:RecG-like helicase